MTKFIENNAVKMNHNGFGDSVDELERLVDKSVSEHVLQKHLKEHPYILSQQFTHCHHVIPKVALGNQYETDFMCLDIPSSGKEWIGVELESSHKKVITKQGRKTADLEHAIQQIRDWRSWITNNLSYARQDKEQNGLGLTDIIPRFFGYIVIGRAGNFNSKFNELRRQLFQDELITVRSWDGVIKWARKRAKVYSMHSDALKIIKQQQELHKETEKLHKLQTLVSDIKNHEEHLELINQNTELLEQQYDLMLIEIEREMPNSLQEKISKLIAKKVPVKKIIQEINDVIPSDIPEKILEDYIVKKSTK